MGAALVEVSVQERSEANHTGEEGRKKGPRGTGVFRPEGGGNVKRKVLFPEGNSAPGSGPGSGEAVGGGGLAAQGQVQRS